MDITRWSILKSYWLYSLQPSLPFFAAPKMEKLYTVSRNKTGSWLWLRSLTPYSKFRLTLKKVGKITMPFRYDWSQISYDYTVEVTNRSDRVSEELWTEVHNIVTVSLILLIVPNVYPFTLSILFTEPRISNAQAKRLEEDARRCRNCRHAYCLLADMAAIRQPFFWQTQRP